MKVKKRKAKTSQLSLGYGTMLLWADIGKSWSRKIKGIAQHDTKWEMKRDK